MITTFATNPVLLCELLDSCAKGKMQLPDFQRSWVWDDDRIRSLIASISAGFPVGALMTLETGGDVDFHPRTVQGAPAAAQAVKPASLLLDGQQRMTSLYQALFRRDVIVTRNIKGARVERFYYLDMKKALDDENEREEDVVGVPGDKTVRENFGKDIKLDLRTDELEYEQLIFPLNRVFDYGDWGIGFFKHWMNRVEIAEMLPLWQRFDREVLKRFATYAVPVIQLGRDTSREAICLVFEKVNTGGKALDAFELVTAMFAASGFRLREDWAAREKRLHAKPALSGVASIDFLQAISIVATAETRAARIAAGETDPPPVSASRQSLLRLKLDQYRAHADAVEAGFIRAAKMLHSLRIYRLIDLPYQSQLVGLASILAIHPQLLEHAVMRDRLARWYWCGVFGELYGGSTETRIARDYVEVPGWARGGDTEPATVQESTFRADRLLSLQSRLSAAYKGVNALLMEIGARDLKTGQSFDQTVFFAESVDIHHIFPRHWCDQRGIKPTIYNSIINKTPLAKTTNIILGGQAPSTYLGRLEKGWGSNPPIDAATLDDALRSHLIDVAAIRSDSFDAHMAARREALIGLIERVTGKSVYRGDAVDEAEGAPDDVAAAEIADKPLSFPIDAVRF